jgi:DNA (cytosine-5)-methyltransferase 1
VNEPTHLDLFSGIGGFALAAQWAGFKTIQFVERDGYCQKVLAKNFPQVPIFADICEFNGKPFTGVDLLTGGFPCQPFSCAGLRKGKEDDRYLWPEMFRVISEAKPHWIISENVAGLDGMGLDDCISDLESIGYEVAPPLEIPAVAVGARHGRMRLWITANRSGVTVEKSEMVSPARAIQKPRKHRFGLATYLWKPNRETYLAEMDGSLHGVSDWLDRSEALGNSIVPQVAYQIIKEIRKLI